MRLADRLRSVPQKDGSFIVYPTGLWSNGYLLKADENERFKEWVVKQRSLASSGLHGYVSIALILASVGLAFVLSPQNPAGSLLALVLPTVLCVMIWYKKRAKRLFRNQFPRAARAIDRQLSKRRILYHMIALPFGPWSGLAIAIIVSVVALTTVPSAIDAILTGTGTYLEITNNVVFALGFPMFVIFFDYLMIYQIIFRLRHGRAPNESDIEAL